MTENRRFLRTEALLGKEGMDRLQQATVMVVGLGAVGGYALEALARSGIGHLILVDFDVIEESNVNRQILALTSTIGEKKTIAAAKRVAEINPTCRVEVREMFANQDTIDELLRIPTDYVVDAIDALNPKCGLIEELWRRKIPFVSSMGAALKTDAACIKFGRLNSTKNCGLAKFIRKRLKKRGVALNEICCVSSDEQICYSENAVFMEEDVPNRQISCQQQGRVRNTLGSLPTITAIFGLTIANQIIQSIAGNKNLLGN